MGSLEDGTMCAYCDEEEAGYIPDGLCGPTCGSCLDLWIAAGAKYVHLLRYHRWWRGVLGRLTAWRQPAVITTTEIMLRDPSIAVYIAEFLVVVTDGSEHWPIPTPLTYPVGNAD